MEKTMIAVEVGNANLLVMAAQPDENGLLKILGLESTLTPKGCINNGLAVKQISDIQAKINESLTKLGNHNGMTGKPCKFYAAVNAHSLCTLTIKVDRNIEKVTPELLNDMQLEAQRQIPTDRVCLKTLSVSYLLDGEYADSPLNMQGSQMTATYAMAVMKKAAYEQIQKLFTLKNYELAGLFVAPEMVGDALVSDEDKRNGCVVVDFGAGCTSVAIYKEGTLIDCAVIPLGGKHITSDLMSFNVSENEAEQLKRMLDKLYFDDSKSTKSCTTAGRKIPMQDVYDACRARLQEIVDYVINQVQQYTDLDDLKAGMIITGGLSNMPNSDKIIAELSGMKVRVGSYKQCLSPDENTPSVRNEYAQLIGILLHATDNCVTQAIPVKKNKFKTLVKELGTMFD